MVASLTIRPADGADYDRIIGNLDDWWGGRQMATMLPRLFFTHFRPWTYVAERDGSLVGFLAAFQSQTDPELIYCHFIGVAPEARGQRVGESLYLRLFADAAIAGCREVLAVTAPTNEGSVTFHRRLGFEIMPGARERDGIPYTPDYDGPGEDRVRFRRTIPSLALGQGPTYFEGNTMKEFESTMTQKGQVTIPAAIRTRLGLRPKDRVHFAIVGDEVTLKPARSRLLAGVGAVSPHNRPEDWEAVEDEVERLLAADVAAEG